MIVVVVVVVVVPMWCVNVFRAGCVFPCISCRTRVPKCRSSLGSSQASPFHRDFIFLNSLRLVALLALCISLRCSKAASLRIPRLFFPVLCLVGIESTERAFSARIEKREEESDLVFPWICAEHRLPQKPLPEGGGSFAGSRPASWRLLNLTKFPKRGKMEYDEI